MFQYGNKETVPLRVKPYSGMRCDTTIQETSLRATLHRLHRHRCTPCILLRCASQRPSAPLASASSEVSCTRLECHTKLTGFVGNPGLRTLVSPCCSGSALLGNLADAAFNRAPKTIETNFNTLFYRISPDSILTSSWYPTFHESVFMPHIIGGRKALIR